MGPVAMLLRFNILAQATLPAAQGAPGGDAWMATWGASCVAPKATALRAAWVCVDLQATQIGKAAGSG